jgi:outer membrane protein assembly factor BamB
MEAELAMVTDRAALEKNRTRNRKRRRIIWLTVLGALALFFLVYYLVGFTDIFTGAPQKTAESAPQPGEWTMFRRDLAHTGASGNNPSPLSGNISWSFPTGSAIHSSPAVVDGVVYFGSRDSRFYAVDAVTGRQLWAFPTGSWVESSPAVVGGVVYFGCNDSNFYALDAKTGGLKWQYDSQYAVRSSPAVANGTVYFGTDDFQVVALDAATGKVVWRKNTDDAVVSSPAVSKGIVAVGSADGMFLTFNAGNGRSRLEYISGTALSTSPAIKDGVAYFVDAFSQFHAIDTSKKNWLWENKTRFYWNALYLYGVAPRPPAASGYLWSLPLAFGNNAASSAAISDNNAYLGLGKDVISIDLTTHMIAWTFKTGKTVNSSPAIAGDVLYAASQDGYLYALDKTTGTRLWELNLGKTITSSPAVVDGMLYIGCDDGSLYAIK